MVEQIQAHESSGDGVRTVEVVGSDPRERGRQYGEQTREQIDRSIAYYTAFLARKHKIGWPEIAQHALAWEPVIERFDADLAQEVRGIAEGAGRSLGDIIALNARGEMVYGQYVPAAVEGQPVSSHVTPQMALPVEGCTSYALLTEATPDGHVYCGQNWDWRFAVYDTWVVLRIVQPPKPTVTTVVEAGQVGRFGANSAGIAVFANGLSGFCTAAPGVPQPFIRRRVLDSASFSGALEVVLSAKQQIAANLLLVHRDGVAIDIETTPERRGWLYPTDGILVHGNHYEAFSWARDGDSYKPYGADSLYRVWRVREGLKSCRGVADGEAVRGHIATALRDHFGAPDAVCHHAEAHLHPLKQWQTLTSSIIDLTTGEWRLAAGTPCDHTYDPLPWNLYQ